MTRTELVRRLRDLHALKAGALSLFDPMLVAVDAARTDPRFDEVADLLGRMRGAFGDHRDETARHADGLADALRQLGATPSRPRVGAFSRGAGLRARIGLRGGMDFGSAATEAFVFEHLEIAACHLAGEIARRVDELRTADLLDAVRADDEGMAATIGRNWTNVTSLALASRRLPVLRPPEPTDPP